MAGVHCVTALLIGQPIEGTWFDRTNEWEARQRRQFATTETVNLAPLPCSRHLTPEQYNQRIAEWIEVIIAQAADRRGATGIEPLGPAAILRQQPFSQPAKTKRSPAPLVHAASKRDRTERRIAYAWFSRAFRKAAEYLRGGDPARSVSPREFPARVAFRSRGPAGDQVGLIGRSRPA